jgi:hypothetical protein
VPSWSSGPAGGAHVLTPAADTLSIVVVVLGPVAVTALLGLLAYWVRGRRRTLREAKRRPPTAP